MLEGAITSYIDVAQVVLYGFWIFFAGLIFYIRREDKREGYPLDSDRSTYVRVQGFPAMPEPKTFLLAHGGTQVAPRDEEDTRELAAEPVAAFPGAPLEPTGDGMGAGVGPGAWAERADTPDMTWEGQPRIVPLRVATEHSVSPKDANPVGMTVLGADGEAAGTCTDVWVDLTEPHVRYLEVAVDGAGQVLLPIYFAKIHGGAGEIRVAAILAEHFANVPKLASPDQVTLREEDQICAYYGGGTLFAEASRREPIL